MGLSDRLGDRLNRIPLVPVGENERLPDDTRSFKRMHGIVIAGVFGPLALMIGIPLTLYATWWGTHTTATCTVQHTESEIRTSRNGESLVYTIDTDCGRLQVTDSGSGMDREETQSLGDSLLTGERYRLQLRGWEGLLGIPRAIVAAEPAPTP